MRELPEPIVEALIDYREAATGDVIGLQRTDADHLQQLSAFAAAVLGVDLSDLAAHVEDGPS